MKFGLRMLRSCGLMPPCRRVTHLTDDLPGFKSQQWRPGININLSKVTAFILACVTSKAITMSTMRAVVYDSPFKVSVRNVPKPTILHPDDVIVKGILELSCLHIHQTQSLFSNHNLYLRQVQNALFTSLSDPYS
jgi:hypothetical protein